MNQEKVSDVSHNRVLKIHKRREKAIKETCVLLYLSLLAMKTQSHRGKEQKVIKSNPDQEDQQFPKGNVWQICFCQSLTEIFKKTNGSETELIS